jgi:Fe-S oxidoreductase/nitrate reductase gamma subunit
LDIIRDVFQHVPLSFVIAWYAIGIISAYIFITGIRRHVQAWRQGKAEQIHGTTLSRLKRLVYFGLAQGKILNKKYNGIMHALISIVGFLLLLGMFFPMLEGIVGYLALLFALGLILLEYKRLRATGPPLETAWEDSFVFGVIVAMAVSGFLMMGVNTWAWNSPAGEVLSPLFTPLGPKVLVDLYPSLFLIHSALVFSLIAYIPNSRLIHLITSPTNVYCAPITIKGEMTTPFDLKQMMESGNFDVKVGASEINDFTWRQKLSFDACTLCQRCSDACPAKASGTKLSPMHLILKLKNLELQPPDTMKQLHGQTVDPEELWACTTCRACVQECPVLIHHVDAICDMRRHLMAEGKVDKKKRDLLTFLTTVGNTYGLATSDRTKWAEGLDVKPYGDEPDQEFLYWVGCAGSYDTRNQMVSRALVKIMKAAQIKFGILGNDEKCNCEVARRVGEEGRFQQAAMELIDLMNKRGVKKIVTQCPHCYNTFKNEYPRFGATFQVIHHSQLIAQLLREGKLKLKKGIEQAIAYHDPCYLGRYNDEYEAPRNIIRTLSNGKLVELPRSRAKSFCCGGGGGNTWYTVEAEKKCSVIRIDEAQQLAPNILAAACPYCISMFEDASKVLGTSEKMPIRDIAELVAEALE